MTKKSLQNDTTPVGYSYIRFSSSKQEEGDSLRRQTKGAEDWCRKNNVRLDTSLNLKDLGVSAFKGKHRSDGHALGAFLKLAEHGKIPKGSYLIIENLDRLSRENEEEALRLWLSILDHKINIVTLTSGTVFRPGKISLFDIIRAIIELSLAHRESQKKSERVSEAKSQRRKRGREEEIIITDRTPAWIKVYKSHEQQKREQDHYTSGRPKPEQKRTDFELIRERADVIKQMFKWCIEGRGLTLIVKQLTKEEIPTWGRSKHWNKAYVKKIIRGKTVLGELQPTKGGKPDGEPILNYYPPVIDQKTYDQAQAAMEQRRRNPGIVGEKVASLFTGLLWDAETQTKMLITNRRKKDLWFQQNPWRA